MFDSVARCPFCGSRNLKAFTKLAGRYMNRYYRAQVHCLKCGARGPLVRQEGYVDCRNTVLTKEGEESLYRQAFKKFRGEKEDDFFK